MLELLSTPVDPDTMRCCPYIIHVYRIFEIDIRIVSTCSRTLNTEGNAIFVRNRRIENGKLRSCVRYESAKSQRRPFGSAAIERGKTGPREQ